MNEGTATLEKSVVKPEKRLYTYDEVVAEFPETNQPCELWDGELVMSPSPSFFHQEIVGRFYYQLYEWVTKHKLGKVIGAPIDMILSPHRVTQPDVAFIAKDRLGIIGRVINGPVDLAAEVISLGNRNRDRIEKRDLYEQYGVKEYWIIDLAGSTRPRMRDGVWLSGDERRAVLVVQTRAAGFDIDAQEQALALISGAFARVRQGVPAAETARLLESGPGVFAVRARTTMQRDATRFSKSPKGPAEDSSGRGR